MRIHNKIIRIRTTPMQLSVKIHLRMILPGRLHGEAHQVAAADLPELQGLRLLLLGLHHQQRDPQQDRPKQITQRFENLAEVGNHAVFCTIALSCARLLCFRKIARQRGPRVSEPAPPKVVPILCLPLCEFTECAYFFLSLVRSCHSNNQLHF